MENQLDLFAPPTNSVISDLALDLGEFALDLELEETWKKKFVTVAT